MAVGRLRATSAFPDPGVSHAKGIATIFLLRLHIVPTTKIEPTVYFFEFDGELVLEPHQGPFRAAAAEALAMARGSRRVRIIAAVAEEGVAGDVRAKAVYEYNLHRHDWVEV